MQTLFFCDVERYNFWKRVSEFTPKKFYEIDFWGRIRKYSSNNPKLINWFGVRIRLQKAKLKQSLSLCNEVPPAK